MDISDFLDEADSSMSWPPSTLLGDEYTMTPQPTNTRSSVLEPPQCKPAHHECQNRTLQAYVEDEDETSEEILLATLYEVDIQELNAPYPPTSRSQRRKPRGISKGQRLRARNRKIQNLTPEEKELKKQNSLNKRLDRSLREIFRIQGERLERFKKIKEMQGELDDANRKDREDREIVEGLERDMERLSFEMRRRPGRESEEGGMMEV